MAKTDITFKELFGSDVQPLLRLLLPSGVGPFQVVELNPELPATLRRVDLLVQGVCQVTLAGPRCERLIALDWQVQSDPDLPATMLLRGAMAYYKYRLVVTTLLLAATRAAAECNPQVVWAEGQRGQFAHEAFLIKLYDVEAELALAAEQPELWMLAAAMATANGDRAELLARVHHQIATAPELGPEKRQRLLDFATTLATLELNKEAARAIVQGAQRRSQLMLDLRQSGYAQMLLAEGEANGEAKGEARGKAEGKAEAILAILEARRVPLGEAARRKLLGCVDLALLRQWLTMAIEGNDAELRQQVEAEQAA